MVRDSSGRSIIYTAFDLPSRMTNATTGRKVEFQYGAGRERVRRADYASVTATTPAEVTHFVGSAEVHFFPGSTAVEVKRYLGPILLVQRRDVEGTVRVRRDYLFVDALGSTHSVTDEFGVLRTSEARMSFDAWGARRTPGTGAVLSIWQQALLSTRETTRHGFTGHEEVDGLGITHMNGRLYDARLGRFLQADSVVQDPYNSQSHNRYSYAFNNPLGYTDPSGNISWKMVVVVAISIYTGGAAAGYWLSLNAAQAAGLVIAGGFVSGAVQTGNLKGALTGALTSAIAYGAGSLAKGFGPLARASAVGLSGGVNAELQGGKFGNGFASAAFSSVMSPVADLANGAIAGSGVVAAALIGGTTSVLAGDKFVNGAGTAALSYAAVIGKTRSQAISVGGGSDEGDPAIAALVTKQSNDALTAAGIIGRPYDTLELLVADWADVVNPIAAAANDGKGIEVGSLISKIGTKYSIAGAWSRGSRTNVTGMLEAGPRVAGGTLAAFVHTHPVDITFSYPGTRFYREQRYMAPAGDISTAWDAGIDAFVSMPSGAIDRWTYSGMNKAIQNSYGARSVDAFSREAYSRIRQGN